MAKRKKAGSARDRRRQRTTAVKHIKKLETQVKNLRQHLEMGGSDPFNQR
jgi:hypothetical protein